MDRAELVEAWRREERQPFAGWDFSYLDGRMVEEQPPWSYAVRAGALMDRAASVVDLDTGGGERLLALRPHWPAKVVATEGYPPSVQIARERLSPRGVTIVAASDREDALLPFAEGEFDVVLNRHGSFNAAEVARILAPGGTFLTQQVHGRSAEDLQAVFGASPERPDASAEKYIPRLQAAGLAVTDVEDSTSAYSFTDVGAVVYYLCPVPWLVPGFAVETHLDALLRLQDILDSSGSLTFTARTYLVEAHKTSS